MEKLIEYSIIDLSILISIAGLPLCVHFYYLCLSPEKFNFLYSWPWNIDTRHRHHHHLPGSNWEHHKTILSLLTFRSFSDRSAEKKNCDIIFQFAYFSHQWLSPFSNFGHAETYQPSRWGWLLFALPFSRLPFVTQTLAKNLFFSPCDENEWTSHTNRTWRMTFCGGLLCDIWQQDEHGNEMTFKLIVFWLRMKERKNLIHLNF